MGIYTKKGDLGETGLPGGERISKNSPRTESYGTLDELNAVIGLLLSDMPEPLDAQRRTLSRIQSDIFNAACHLAGTGTSAQNVPSVAESRIEELETAIDDMTSAMPELHSFVLPCGCRSAARAHVARTVCRRAERRLVHFFETLPDGAVSEQLFTILRYINRLSDYLFTLARYANHTAGPGDTPWTAG